MTGGSRRQGREGERGLALLVVLWAVTAAALLVSAFNVVARSGAVFMSAEVALTEAEALADVGLEIAAAHLIDGDKTRRWRANGRPHRIALGEAELTIVIDDPNGLVDVNKASREVLLGALRRAMAAPEQAEAMLERLMELRGSATAGAGESAPVAQPDAAQPSSEPQDREPGGAPQHAPTRPVRPRIRDVTELRHVEGMTSALYRKLAPLLTVYSRDGRINPFHAPRAVLESLPGLGELDVDRFLASRPPDAGDDEPIPGGIGKAGAFLANRSGPAAVVSVAVGKPGQAILLGRQYVIVTGLDADAPYRLIAIRPLSADDVIPQSRTPQS